MILQLIVVLKESMVNLLLTDRNVYCDLVLVIGVKNGAAALVPLEAVTLGVAKAGAPMTNVADTNTNVANTAVLRIFIVLTHPFASAKPHMASPGKSRSPR